MFYKFRDGEYYTFPFEFKGEIPKTGIYDSVEGLKSWTDFLDNYSFNGLVTLHGDLIKVVILDELGKAEIKYS